MLSPPVESALFKPGLRIFAPIAYQAVREQQVVPIAATEAMAQSVWHPVVWRRIEGGAELIVVRSLLSDGRGHPAGAPAHPDSLPLLLRAFPFEIEAVEDEPPRLTVNSEVPDAPTDRGAAILRETGKLGRGAEQRCRALAVFWQATTETHAMTRFLVEHDLLEHWDFQLVVKGLPTMSHELLAVRQSAYTGGTLAEFVSTYGAGAARLLMSHRVSLFRAAVLMKTARRALGFTSQGRSSGD